MLFKAKYIAKCCYLKTVKNREEKNSHVKKKTEKKIRAYFDPQVPKRGVIGASAFSVELEFNNTALFSLYFIVFHS